MFFLPSTQGIAFDNPRFLAFEDRNHVLNAIELRTLGKVPNLEAQVRHALADVNPDLAAIDFKSFEEQVENNFSQQKMIAKLTSLFGLLALVLASVGLYGVTAYSVERRTNEIGIRMALGAGRLSVLKLVLKGALVQMGLALAVGIPTTIAAGHAMATAFRRQALRSQNPAFHNRRASIGCVLCGCNTGAPCGHPRSNAGTAHRINV
jgi:ABC-type antimicrobial peptide transport system permease subunit